MDRKAMAYLLPFALTNNLDYRKQTKDHSAYAHAYMRRLGCLELTDQKLWDAPGKKKRVADTIGHISTLEEERAFFRGLIECCTFRFHNDHIATRIPIELVPYTRTYCKDVLCEKIGGKNGKRFCDIWFSWELFAHLVFWTIYQDSELYQSYNEKIYKHFNLTRFLPMVKEVAQNSICHKLHVGAMLIVDGKLRAKGWNCHPAGTRRDDVCLRMQTKHATDISHGYCIHAEAQLLLRCNPTQLKNGIIFVTHPPCEHCARHLIQAKVPLVIFTCGGYSISGIECAWNLGGKTRFFGV